MNNNEYNFINFGSDSCVSKGSCALTPDIASLQEVILYFIKLTSVYIIKLYEFSLSNSKLNERIIDILASLLYVNEYSEKQMYEMAQSVYLMYKSSMNRYIFECSKNNIKPDLTEEIFESSRINIISEVISFGNLLLKKIYYIQSTELRNSSQILFTVLKSVCQNISKLFDFNIHLSEVVSKVISVLSDLNNFDFDKILYSTKDLSDIDFELNLALADSLIEKYGAISNVTVSHSTRKGKCILVSGNNFADLKNILEQTKNLNIDIYTHSDLLISHCLGEFRKFPNLCGHYGRSTENCIVDYGTFPGAILLTKNSKNNTEYLYRGKIFSNDYVTPVGVTKIIDNDYTELINSALKAKGFKKGRQMADSNLGYDEHEIDILIRSLTEKLAISKLSRLYVIAPSSFSEVQKEYFNLFLNKIKSDEFVISFSHESGNKSVRTINIGNYGPLFCYLLNKLITNKQCINKIHYIFPKCDASSISAIINLKNAGISNLYTSLCSAKTINPSAFGLFAKQYGIGILSDAQKDIKNMRKKSPQ